MENNFINSASNILYNATSTANKMAEKGKEIFSDNRLKSEIKKLEDKINEHKYNIGKLIYDNEMDIDDGRIISNINSIDRLVEDIGKLEGKTNG